MTHSSKSQQSLCDVLAAFNSWEKREFKYGDSDCCAFVAHVATELTGIDYKKHITYASEAEAYGIIESHGGFESLMNSTFSTSGIPTDGDPCLLKLPVIGEIMGIKYKDTVVCVTKHGLTQVPDRYIVRGWNLCHRQ